MAAQPHIEFDTFFCLEFKTCHYDSSARLTRQHYEQVLVSASPVIYGVKCFHFSALPVNGTSTSCSSCFAARMIPRMIQSQNVVACVRGVCFIYQFKERFIEARIACRLHDAAHRL